MHEERRAPTADYILRTDSPGHFRSSASLRRGLHEHTLAEASTSHSADYTFDQFANAPKIQRPEPWNATNCVTGQNFKVAQPLRHEPPPYFQPCLNTVVCPQFSESSYIQESPDSYFLQQPHITYRHRSQLPDTFAATQQYPITFENWRDFRVLPIKLADDPGRNDSEADDRHRDRPLENGDRRPPPLPPFGSGPLASAPYPQQHQYQPYSSHSGYPTPGYPPPPPPGFAPFEGSRSPQHSRYPPPYPTGYPPQPFAYPPIGAPPTAPSYMAAEGSYPHRGPAFPSGHRSPGNPYIPFNYPESRVPLPIHGHPSNIPGNPPLPPPIHGHPPYPLPHGPFRRPASPQPPNIPVIGAPSLTFGPPPVQPSYLPSQGPRPYELRIRQQPERARMCGFGEKDRRPIDPPPVVEIIAGTEPLTPTAVQSLVLQCTLWNEDGTQHRNIIRTEVGPAPGLGTAEELPVQREEKHARVMMGNVFANALHLEDEHKQLGYLCIFSDLSIRVEGIYRLKFDLLRLAMPPQPVAGANTIIAVALSDRFQVFPAKRFGGMSSSSPLTMALARQGVKIHVRTRRDRTEQGADQGGEQGEQEGEETET